MEHPDIIGDTGVPDNHVHPKNQVRPVSIRKRNLKPRYACARCERVLKAEPPDGFCKRCREQGDDPSPAEIKRLTEQLLAERVEREPFLQREVEDDEE